ncbi:squalene--hopene cyclase [Paenibacillus sp. GCM10012307]|uniref:Squalene--hopene cyclase n=1 Tax=Paenibacillus roseus TaxID=2798579 RepID=A0A934MNU3_9BACL|nr:squalene--hopene cyclase [Paenibacillus roseus]MBJ6359769.1 squalene--hopene cyclase [Paenibacillus roseus]
MSQTLSSIEQAIDRITADLLRQQRQDGAWEFCFENGTNIDCYLIILLRSLEMEDEELIRQLHDRILQEQQADGSWKLFRDEDGGNLSATIDAYYALLYSGYSSRSDEGMERARRFIQSRGGLGKATSILTQAILSATGQTRWPLAISTIPLELLLLPASFPISFFDFSCYSRVHLAPILIMADRRFSIQTEQTPDLSGLKNSRTEDDHHQPRGFKAMIDQIETGVKRLIGVPRHIHEAATRKAETFMLQRIEPDGTLYTYASCTILMIFSLLALGYDKNHPIITRAVQGIKAMQFRLKNGRITIQNSPSTIWDTALLTYALQTSGLSDSHPAIRRAAAYLRGKQQDKPGDWSIHNPGVPSGGWGFSEPNTIIPDVDDSTAALRVLAGFSRSGPEWREAWNRGLNWVISMQNKDGGWPAFEKDTSNHLLIWLAIDGAKSAAIDPSEADLTGRTLEYLGNFTGMDTRHTVVRRGTDWLIGNQGKDGSWYGRWGVCYIYGTWAALTGLVATGVPSSHHAVQKGVKWLFDIQNEDGGWGESCKSDRLLQYTPLGESTPSQTAWALDALIASLPSPNAKLNRGVNRLIAALQEDNWKSEYPTGAGLPGNFYIHYHSYRYIWPLLALSHYKQKYGKL